MTNRNWSLALVLLVAACGASSREAVEGDSADAGAPLADGGHARAAIVYAHNSATLFALDPNTFDLTTIGPMTGCSGIVDIAVNANNQIFGSGYADDMGSGIVAIDPATGACHGQVRGGFANALSFVPRGVLSPDKEMLVTFGSTGGGAYQYVAIDPDTGEVASIGDPPAGYGSSGDIVSVEGGGTYWTATGPCNDCLVELDPATGALIKDWGSIGYPGVWGLAYWGGQVYGFTSNGAILLITFVGDMIMTTLVAQTSQSFYGAGSTTTAPIILE